MTNPSKRDYFTLDISQSILYFCNQFPSKPLNHLAANCIIYQPISQIIIIQVYNCIAVWLYEDVAVSKWIRSYGVCYFGECGVMHDIHLIVTVWYVCHRPTITTRFWVATSSVEYKEKSELIIIEIIMLTLKYFYYLIFWSYTHPYLMCAFPLKFAVMKYAKHGPWTQL